MGNHPTKLFKDVDSPKKIDLDNLYMRRIMKAKEEMTGFERVQMVFSKNELGEIAPEFQRCFDATLIACFVGAFLGGVGRSRIAYMDFFRRNTHTPFETPLQAKRALQDKVVIGMGSGAFRIGWRMAAFTFMYMTTATAIAAYRGKIGIIDQVGGAGLAGFLYKFREGPKAAVSGTVFGSLLGLVAGTITMATVAMFGLNIESANMYYYHRLALRQEKERARLIIARESNESNSLTKFHENMFASTQVGIPNANDASTSVTPPSSAVPVSEISSSSSLQNRLNTETDQVKSNFSSATT